MAAALARLREDKPVVVMGEGGVGKSTLIEAVAAADGRPVRAASALASMSWREYWPLSAALDGRALAGDVEAVAGVVEAEVGPDVLLIDDLHLADSSTIEVLAALAGRVAFLGAGRVGEGSDAVGRLEEAGAEVLSLTPLEPPAAQDLVRLLAPDLPPGRVDAIVSGSAGLPLLIEFLSGVDPDAPVGRGLVPSIDALGDEEIRAATLLAVAAQPVDVAPGALVSHGIAVQETDGRLRIRHQLVADAVLARATPGQVADAHRRLAEAARDPGEAAHHWLAAGEPTRARQQALVATAETTSLSDRARLLDLVARCDETDGPRATLTAARSLADCGLYAEAEAALDRWSWPEQEPLDRAEELLIRARVAWHAGDAAAAMGHARQGLTFARGTGTSVEAQLLIESVRCEVLSVGLTDDQDARLERAAAIIGEGAGRGALLNVAAILPYFRTGEGIAEWQAGREAALAEGDVDTAMRCANNIIMWNEASGDQIGALQMATAMQSEAAERGLGAWELQFAAAAANLLYHSGRYPEAVPILERVLADALDQRTREQARVVYVSILIDLGMLDAARATLPPLPTATSQDWLHDNSLFSVHAALEFGAGRPRAVLTIADQFAQRAPTDSATWMFLIPIRAWAQYDLGLPVDGTTQDSSIPLMQGLIRETQGVALLAVDPHEAVEVLDGAAGIGLAWTRAQGLRAQWGAAEAARIAGRADAVERLLAAEEAVAAIGMEPLLARVHRSLRLAGVARAARRAPDRSGLLTERERLVLDLLAEGATYSEIARRLGVGRPTVRRLGQNAQLKLGVDSRLAAVVAAAQS
jgi:DNA-binding CsgD family transcriptional regulator/tetratricopeptide (TPR) repeat protein